MCRKTQAFCGKKTPTGDPRIWWRFWRELAELTILWVRWFTLKIIGILASFIYQWRWYINFFWYQFTNSLQAPPIGCLKKWRSRESPIQECPLVNSSNPKKAVVKPQKKSPCLMVFGHRFTSGSTFQRTGIWRISHHLEASDLSDVSSFDPLKISWNQMKSH